MNMYNSILVTILVLFSVFAVSFAEPESSQIPALSVEIVAIDIPKVTLRIKNNSDKTVRIWRLGSMLGDEQLSFRFIDGNRHLLVTYKALAYSLNVPAPEVIEKGKYKDWNIDFSNPAWRQVGSIDMIKSYKTIEATVTVQANDDTKEQEIKVGSWISKAVPFKNSPRFSK